MEDTMLTIAMFCFLAVIIFIRYGIPLLVSIIGGVLIKRKMKVWGYILLSIGVLIEVVNVIIQILSFM